MSSVCAAMEEASVIKKKKRNLPGTPGNESVRLSYFKQNPDLLFNNNPCVLHRNDLSSNNE